MDELAAAKSMTADQRNKLEKIIVFHHDLLKLRDMLIVQECAEERATREHGKPPKCTDELERLRQSLLRRVSPIEGLFKSVTGRQLFQRGMFGIGGFDAWHLALQPTEGFRQSHHAGLIADELNKFVGQLEEEPSLLDPPQPMPDQQKTHGGQAEDSRAVFVVHGRNDKAREAMFTFLRAIGLHPLEWSQAVLSTGKASPYVGEILDVAFAKAQAVVVLMTPDDEARLRKQFQGFKEPAYETEITPQPRQNVLFEAGMAMGRSPNRTVLVELGGLRPFSDISGLHVIKLENATQKRKELAQRLQSAGCSVDLTGTDWITAGDFDGAIDGPS